MKSRVPFHRALTFPALALALLALAHSAIAANTADNFLTSAPSAGSLVNSTYWSLSALPTVSNDAVFPFGSATGIRTLSANNLTVGSFDNLATSGTMSLRNETSTATDSILTLGGAGNLGNASAGADPSDLLFVGSGGTLNITGPNGSSGSGVLKLRLDQSGNFNATGTLGISAVIGETTSYGITKTGAGTLTLNSSAASNFTGGLSVNGGTLTEDFANMGATADLINGVNTLALGGGILNVKGNSANNSNQTLGNVTINAGGGQILVNPNGASRTAALTLGTITATTTGGTLLVGKTSGAAGTATITTGSAPDPTTGIKTLALIRKDEPGGLFDWLGKASAAVEIADAPHPRPPLVLEELTT